jgi:hypothetical protein
MKVLMDRIDDAAQRTGLPFRAALGCARKLDTRATDEHSILFTSIPDNQGGVILSDNIATRRQ